MGSPCQKQQIHVITAEDSAPDRRERLQGLQPAENGTVRMMTQNRAHPEKNTQF